ncbi:serine/arginine repetitive matrix protein 2-like [Xiphias gladius]|uniref:serine/arginine repetitive matrix protein 2-like n=1 Tax=Xiphias gladius TaxID=8245 RepID=UPI001A998CC0|nr:serine/arginine repetitive matrix protein 2-like [Xiphias gladius]
MQWCTEMACGVHLGILLILVQAEHVRCLWATQAWPSQRQQDNGLRRLDSSYPQNQFRQASISLGSAQSSSLHPETAVGSGYNQGLSRSSYTQTVSRPAQSGYASAGLIQSSLVSKPNRETMKRVNVQKVPNNSFGLSTSIASGSSVSLYSQSQNEHTISKGKTWPVQQGTQRAGQYLSSSSASVQSPSRERASDKSAPRAMKSSSLFSAVAHVPMGDSVQRPTLARAPARRVSSHRSAGASKRSRFSSQTLAGQPYQNKLFPVNGENAQGSYKPTSNMASSHARYTQSLPAHYKQNPASFEPHSLKMPTSQFTYKPGFSSTEQIPSSESSVQALWNRNWAQGTQNAAASGSSRAGTSSQRFAPTRTHNIPKSFGGFAIRRLRGPDAQKKAGIQKPRETYTLPPRQTAPYEPKDPSVHQASKWKRIRLYQGP